MRDLSKVSRRTSSCFHPVRSLGLLEGDPGGEWSWLEPVGPSGSCRTSGLRSGRRILGGRGRSFFLRVTDYNRLSDHGRGTAPEPLYRQSAKPHTEAMQLGGEIKQLSPDNVAREELPGGEWETAVMEGCWRKGQNAGGSRNFPSFHTNPAFPLSVTGQSSVKVSLRQHCPDNKCRPIGFHIFQVPSDNNNMKMPLSSCLQSEPVVNCVPHSYSQEVGQVCRLASGNYAIVPSTYLPDTEGRFTLIVATQIDRKSIQIQETLGQRLEEVSFKAVMKM
uniref:Uncharacterized protein n=1 Tax=Sphaerodactylus townsendi TaxID=933632 RepID=A0ACB8FCG2_9SAUR